MKVALDATPLTEPMGGIRRYTIQLANALAKSIPEDEYLLVSDQSYQHTGLEGVRAERRLSRRWWSWGLPRFLALEHVDIFHGTDFSVPYLPLRPTVMTVHDLSPWRTGGSARIRRRTPLLLRFGLATMVITPTEAIRREVIDFFRMPPEEVVAVPLAAAAHFLPVEAPPPERPFFFFVGGHAGRKNIGIADDACRELRRRGHAIDLKVADGNVPEATLPLLYSQATAVLYPSLYEGFGLPVLEAMQCGTPVIASLDPAITEVAAGACVQIDAENARAWMEAMEGALQNHEFREHWGRKGLHRARQFCWTRTAAETRKIYMTAMRRFHG